MAYFPDDSRYPRSSDGSEPILGGSIGLNRILISLKEQAQDRNRMMWSAVLVSAYTVFRNIYVKGITPIDLATRFRTDMDLLRLYLDAYLTAQKLPQITIPLVIYNPNYSYLKAEFLREPSPTNAELLEKFTSFAKGLPPDETLYGSTDGTTMMSVSVGNAGMLPHIELAHWLQNKALSSPHFGYKYGQPVLMLTHCPIDLHITRRLPKVFLIESYQGTVRPSKEFGRKLEKGNDTIPFQVATHRAFGDPVHLKTLATRDQKKQLLAMAETRKWLQLPQEAVMRDVVQVLGSSIAELTKIKL